MTVWVTSVFHCSTSWLTCHVTWCAVSVVHAIIRHRISVNLQYWWGLKKPKNGIDAILSVVCSMFYHSLVCNVLRIMRMFKSITTSLLQHSSVTHLRFVSRCLLRLYNTKTLHYYYSANLLHKFQNPNRALTKTKSMCSGYASLLPSVGFLK